MSFPWLRLFDTLQTDRKKSVKKRKHGKKESPANGSLLEAIGVVHATNQVLHSERICDSCIACWSFPAPTGDFAGLRCHTLSAADAA